MINLGAETAGALETAFRQPPAGAHAKTWWHWMNGNVTAEGITLDIEAMKRAGIRGFQIFQVGTGIPKGPVDYSSTEHTRLLQHAAKEAERLGMEFDIMNCPGWSSSGGPWITPELLDEAIYLERNAGARRAASRCRTEATVNQAGLLSRCVCAGVPGAGR